MVLYTVFLHTNVFECGKPAGLHAGCLLSGPSEPVAVAVSSSGPPLCSGPDILAACDRFLPGGLRGLPAHVPAGSARTPDVPIVMLRILPEHRNDCAILDTIQTGHYGVHHPVPGGAAGQHCCGWIAEGGLSKKFILP